LIKALSIIVTTLTYPRLETNWKGDSMKNIHFFACKEDLLVLLELIDGQGPLKYALARNFPKHETDEGISVFDTGAAIPNLGKARTDSSTTCERFLVCERDTPINLRHLQGIDGGERVCVDQLANPDSVILLPGGIWNEDVVIQGHTGTASNSQISQALMKRFQAAIKKAFRKVKAFYVGPKALALLENGKRLTSSAQSPDEYDLTTI
jgi:hypothetical protein